MTTYSRSDLEQKRDELKQTIRDLDIERANYLLDRRINNFDFQLLGNELNAMSTQVNKFDTQVVMMQINQITIDPNSPGAKLGEATNDIKAAVTQLDQVQQTILEFAQVVNAVTDITSELMRRQLLPLG